MPIFFLYWCGAKSVQHRCWTTLEVSCNWPGSDEANPNMDCINNWMSEAGADAGRVCISTINYPLIWDSVVVSETKLAELYKFNHRNWYDAGNTVHRTYIWNRMKV